MGVYLHEDEEYLKRIGPEIRAAVAARGMADIPGAVGWIDRVIQHVVATQLGRSNTHAETWCSDKLRAMLALVQAPQWFRAWELDGVRNEFGEPLLAEWVNLARRPRQYGPGHLIAWIWLLNRSLTEPLVDGFMRQVTPILSEALGAQNERENSEWMSDMTDWDSFFRLDDDDSKE